MPDIGGFGRGLLKGALSATEKAAEKVKDAAEAASRRVTADDDPDATQVVKSGDVAQPTAADDPDITQVVKSGDVAQPTAADDDPDITQVIPGSPRPSGPRPTGPHGGPQPQASHGGPRPPQALLGDRPAPHGGPSAPPGDPQASFPGAPLGAPTAFAGNVDAPPASSSTGAPAEGSSQAPPVADTAPEGEPSLADEPEDHADASEVRELVEMFQQLLAKRRPPVGPIPGDWSIGVGDLLAEHPKVPKRVRGLLGKLNRFGGVAYSPREVAFDGDDVAWDKVTEVRTRHVVDYLVGDAVQQQVENLPVPWFPGRKRLLDALGQALLTITIATAKDQLEKFELDLRIPAEIAYKASFGRTKELSAGVVSALVLVDPAVNQSLLATARARGITVTTGDDELLANADERAAQIREKVRALEAELERFTKRFGRSG